jgi:hypothetical protein
MKAIRTNAFRRSSGTTLIECLAYIGVLAVLMSSGSYAVSKAWRASREMSRNSQDIQNALSVGERWRADIRAARGQIRLENATNPEAILIIPTEECVVMYQHTNGTLLRCAAPLSPWVVVLNRATNSAMHPVNQQGVQAWRWELEMMAPRKNASVRPWFTFTAVPEHGSEP